MSAITDMIGRDPALSVLLPSSASWFPMSLGSGSTAFRGRRADPLQEPPSLPEPQQGPWPYGCGWVTSSAPAPTVLGTVSVCTVSLWNPEG